MQTLSAEGTTVLFISSANFDGSNAAGHPECWVVDTTSKAIRSTGHDAAGIAETMLSGNGNVVWAVTLAGRRRRRAPSKGVKTEDVAHTAPIAPPPAPIFLWTVPRSVVRLSG